MVIRSGVLIERGDHNLIKVFPVHPPTRRGLCGVMSSRNTGRAQKFADRFIGNRGAGPSEPGLQGSDVAGGVGQSKEIAILGLPGVLARFLNGSDVAISEESQSSEEFSFSVESHLLLARHDLEGSEG